jgi:effector-binding domain-containing protein
MEIKTQAPVQVLSANIKTSLATIQKDTGETPMHLYDVATKAGLVPAGPQIWRYVGADGNKDTIFSLEMALPVSGVAIGTSLGYNLSETPSFKYVSTIHHGSWDNLYQTYARIIAELQTNGLTMTDECREVYTVVDMENPANNITEVQMGIQ